MARVDIGKLNDSLSPPDGLKSLALLVLKDGFDLGARDSTRRRVDEVAVMSGLDRVEGTKVRG
jgi:hypothetical protein